MTLGEFRTYTESLSDDSGLPIGKLKGYSFPEVTFENSPMEVELKIVK